MANENENTSAPEDKKHESWLEQALEKINTDFPLSGGETDEDLEAATETDEEDYPDAPKNDEEPETPHKSFLGGMLDNIDTDFPLSGGEEEDK